MKIALMSDIHGNYKAFKNALDDAKSNKVDRIICLGDVVGYGYDPIGCIKLAKECCDFVLKGNHDAGVVGEMPLSWFSMTAKEGVLRHRGQIDEDCRKWLSELPYTYKDTENKFVCSHGTYVNPSEYEYVNNSYVANWDLEYISGKEGVDYSVHFTGHTHYSICYDFFESGHKFNYIGQSEGNGVFHIKPKHSYSFNVGSVGYPRNELDSVYVTYETDKKLVEYRRLPFDAEEYKEMLGNNGIAIPHWLSYRVNQKNNIDALQWI